MKFNHDKLIKKQPVSKITLTWQNMLYVVFLRERLSPFYWKLNKSYVTIKAVVRLFAWQIFYKKFGIRYVGLKNSSGPRNFSPREIIF